MNRLTEPVNSWISANGLMLWINKYHFIEFVSRVLSNPVRVQNTKTTTVSSSSLLQQKTRDRRNVYHCLQEFRVQKEGHIKLYIHTLNVHYLSHRLLSPIGPYWYGGKFTRPGHNFRFSLPLNKMLGFGTEQPSTSSLLLWAQIVHVAGKSGCD